MDWSLFSSHRVAKQTSNPEIELRQSWIDNAQDTMKLLQMESLPWVSSLQILFKQNVQHIIKEPTIP